MNDRLASAFSLIPNPFPQGKVLFLIGHENAPGLNKIKEQIAALNRKGTWIDTNFTNASSIDVPSRVCMTLIMIGVRNPVSIRSSARSKGIPCPVASFTTGDIRRLLEEIDRRRKGTLSLPLEQPVLAGHPNGSNGHLKNGAPSSAGVAVLTVETGVMPTNGSRIGDLTVAAPESDPSSPPPPDESPSAEEADPFEELETFKGSIERTQIAVMGVMQMNTELRKEVADLKQQLSARDGEIADLKQQVADKATLMAEIAQLRELQAIIKRAAKM